MTDTTLQTGLSVAIAGVAGRMGRHLVAGAMDAGLSVVGGTEAPGSGPFDRDIGELAGRQALGIRPVTDPVAAAANADVWIDFTRPAATLAALDALKHTRVSGVVIGTTGLSAAQDAEIARAAERLAIVKAGNFSVGINLLQALTRMAASRLGEGWDIEILETHHRRKVDAPSGTALMLGDAAAEGCDRRTFRQSRLRHGNRDAQPPGAGPGGVCPWRHAGRDLGQGPQAGPVWHE